MRLKSPFEITRFPLFQNINVNFFRLKYEQQAQSFHIFLAELWKMKSAGNLECVLFVLFYKDISCCYYSCQIFW